MILGCHVEVYARIFTPLPPLFFSGVHRGLGVFCHSVPNEVSCQENGQDASSCHEPAVALATGKVPYTVRRFLVEAEPSEGASGPGMEGGGGGGGG